MIAAQQIFHPITQRVRAFTWPKEISEIGSVDLGEYIPARSLSDNELMQRMALVDDEDKQARSLARSAQREYQRRAIEQLKKRLGREACGTFIGRKIVFDTETTDIDQGQRVRFGVAEIHGMEFHEITDALDDGATLTHESLNELREIYVFYNPRDLEKTDEVYERSLALLRTMCREREAASGVPHILMEKDDFVSNVVFAPSYIVSRLEPFPLQIPFPTTIIGHHLAFDLGALPSHKARLSKKKGMYGAFSLIMGTSGKRYDEIPGTTREEKEAAIKNAKAQLIEIERELHKVGGPPAKYNRRTKHRHLMSGQYLSDLSEAQRARRAQLLTDRRELISGVLGCAPDLATRYLPRVIVKKVGPQKNTFTYSARGNRLLDTFYFIDTLQLAKALLGAQTPASMDALCKLWEFDLPKEKNADHFKPLRRPYVDYAFNDVTRTWFIYQRLEALYLRHGLERHADRILSEAGLGKAYYQALGVRSFLSKNITDCPEAGHARQMLELCGIAMESMIGARTECGWRHEVIEGQSADFKSQYPTVNSLLRLQDLLICNRLRTVDGDGEGDDAKLLRAITIEGDGPTALLGANRDNLMALWPRLRGYALIDPTDCVLPIRTVFDSADDENEKSDNSNVNVGLCAIASGQRLWVSYPDVLASKFITGVTPTIFKTKRLEPDEAFGMQTDLKAIRIFGDPRYVIDLTKPDVDLYRSLIEMRSSVKEEMKGFQYGSPEYKRLDAMQLALKLLANSTSYGVKVQVDVEESHEERSMTVYHGEDWREVVARHRSRDPLSYAQQISGVKVEKPGTWFDPSGPLITAGGRLLLAVVEVLAREKGLSFGMCDTDSTFLCRPKGMSREAFREAFSTIAGLTGRLQAINPYKPTICEDGRTKVDPVFAIEDINFPFDNTNGKFQERTKEPMKPLYILAIAAKRYAMANIIREDGSEYDDIEQIRAEAARGKTPLVILRKVSGHGLGFITAPAYKPSNKQHKRFMAIEHDGKLLDRQPHLAVPYVIDKGGQATAQYGAVCKGRGNPRLFLDMWKLAFEQFIADHDKSGSVVCHKINREIATWRGLDQPQFMQRALNTAQMWRVYENIPNRRAECFFNILPAMIRVETDGLGLDWKIDRHHGLSMYCSGGSNINVREKVEADDVFFVSDGMPARPMYELTSLNSKKRAYRLTEVRDVIGDYFGHDENKSRGLTRENKGKLYRHKVVIQDREYVGKETNFLLDPDLAEDDDTQAADVSTIPFFREGINPQIKELLADPSRGFHEQAGMTKPDFNRMLAGVRDHRDRAIMGFIRTATTYDEKTNQLKIDPALARKQPVGEMNAEKLADLLRAAYDRVVGYHGEFDEDEDAMLAVSLRYEDFTDMLIPRAASEAPMTLPHRHFLSIGIVSMMIKNGFVSWYGSNGAALQRPVNVEYMADVAKAILGSDEKKRRLEAAHEHRDNARAASGLEVEYVKRNAKIAAKREQNAKATAEILAHMALRDINLRTKPEWLATFWKFVALVLVALVLCCEEVSRPLKRRVSSTGRNPTYADVEKIVTAGILGERRKRSNASAAKRMRAMRARKSQAQQARNEADALVNF
jgi:hypothetical protein